jgi:hypothetical protein
MHILKQLLPAFLGQSAMHTAQSVYFLQRHLRIIDHDLLLLSLLRCYVLLHAFRTRMHDTRQAIECLNIYTTILQVK